jgi:two-component system chemotaxis sensor kinase CheA
MLQIIEKLLSDTRATGVIIRSKVEPLLLELQGQRNLAAAARKLVDRLIVLARGTDASNVDHFLHALSKLAALLKTPEGTGTMRGAVLEYNTSLPSAVFESFHVEVCGHLQNIEEQLLLLENQRANKDALNAVLGAMHSLKGVTGFLDLKIAHQLAHQAEEVMVRARNRGDTLTDRECDTLLRVADVLRSIAHTVNQHSKTPQQPLPVCPPEMAALMSEINELCELKTAARTTSETRPDLPAAAAAPEAGASRQSVDWVRVKVEKLDALVNAIGELLIAQTQLRANLPSGDSRLAETFAQLGRVSRDLQSIGMSMRMFPLRDLFQRMSRLARDVAHKQQKKIEFTTTGEETEMDKNLIEMLVDPLSHLVRNAIDHGIENAAARKAAGKPACATIALSARNEAGKLVLELTDDGQGLDLERIERKARNLGLIDEEADAGLSQVQAAIFAPGFSTAERVTEISGRGVGLDVVKRNIEALQGSVSVSSIRGSGTCFRLTLPLTLAIFDGLLLRCGSHRYVFAANTVMESLQPDPQQFATVLKSGQLLNVRSESIPLIRLDEVLGMTRDQKHENGIILILDAHGQRFALAVDEILGLQPVVTKSFGAGLKPCDEVIGATVLADGAVGLVLDAEAIWQRYQALPASA